MRTKEQYYGQVLENRKLAKDPSIIQCTCPNTLCEWHGKCTECVALHRHHADHIPACLQPILAGKLKQLAQDAEMVVTPKEGTPVEYRHYVRQRDGENPGQQA